MQKLQLTRSPFPLRLLNVHVRKCKHVYKYSWLLWYLFELRSKIREAKQAVQPTAGKEKKSIYYNYSRTIITCPLELWKKKWKENIFKLSNCRTGPVGFLSLWRQRFRLPTYEKNYLPRVFALKRFNFDEFQRTTNE